MKSLKKALCAFLAVIMVLTAAPIGEFAGVDFSNLFATEASAANAQIDDSDYSYMAQVILNYNYNGAALIGDATLSNMRLNRFMDPSICSVSRPTVAELNSNTTFVVSANLWKVATFDLSEMLNSFEEEVGYYQAIILNILNSAIEYSIVPSTITSYTKNITAIQKNIDKYKLEGLDTALGVNLWNSQLSPDEALELYNNLEAERVKVNKRITNSTDVSSLINSTMTVIDVIEKFSAHAAIADLSENIKAVIDELYANCPSSNMALKTALLEVKTVMKSTLDRIGVDLTNAVWQAGKVAIEAALSELWVGALESVVGNLAAGILIGQVIGKAVCNMMFSTDSVIEQWYKLNALVEFEDIMYATINSLSSKFKSSPNEENALVLLSAIEILGNMYIEDYNMSEDLVEYVYEKGLWNNIKKGFLKIFNKYDNSEVVQYHEDINYLKGAVNDLYEITRPDFYISWMIIDKGITLDENATDAKMAKVVSVKCPTDVKIYDTSNNLIVNIVNDEIQCLTPGTYVNIVDSEKTVYLSDDEEYSVKVTATDNGTMDYSIIEIENGNNVRSVVYENVSLISGETYSSSLSLKKYENINNYDLKCEDGTIIDATFDSLPPIEDNIVDVIVAEELFDGFPVEVIDLVADTMFNMKSVVDLSAYDISTDDAVALFSAVAKYYPAEYSLIANSDFTYKIIVSPSLDRIMNIRFYYGDDANLSTYQKRVKDLNAEIDALVAKVEGMNDFEKALYIHDYIVLNSEYDLELLDYMEKNNFILPGELRSEKYTEYSILVNGTGVCGSYALAYRAVLNAAGMDCLYLSSSQMNHAWNLVKIDGNWYHVDCCWDDPIPDTYGRARRTYFLRTDSEIMNLNHYAWSPGQYKATSEKYSDMPRGYDIQQKYDDGKWYYVKGTTLYSSDEYGKNATEITSMSASSIDADDNSVYFSTGRYIYEYDLETSEKNLVYMLSNKDAGEKISDAYLSNIYIDDENVEYYKSIYKDDKRTTLFDTDTLQREKFNAITGIEISQPEVSLDVFETLQLSANIITAGSADDLEVEWISSDESVAKVDSDGNVTAANVGVATITARIFDFASSCTVTVTGDGLTGMCGNNITWVFDVDSKELILSGTGEISSSPWAAIKEEVLCVTINDGITKIGSNAFSDFKNLTNIHIPKSVLHIGEYALYGCEKLVNVVIPEKLIDIGDRAFDGCKVLNQINIPSTVKSIGRYCFFDCTELKRIDITDLNAWCSIDFTYIPFSAYCSYQLFLNGTIVTDLSNATSITTIKSWVFDSCASLSHVTIPKNIKTIEDHAFYGSDIESVYIHDTVNTVGDGAFASCEKLSNVYLGSGVASSNFNSIFFDCTGLKEFNISAQNPTYCSIDDVVFSKDKTKIHIYPSKKEDVEYRIPDSVIYLYAEAFNNNNYLETVYIPKNMQIDGQGCSSSNGYYRLFFQMNNLKEINVDPENISLLSEDGILYTKDKTSLLKFPDNKRTFVYHLDELTVQISPFAFINTNYLRSIILNPNIERFTTGLGIGGTLINGYNSSVEYIYSENRAVKISSLYNFYNIIKVYASEVTNVNISSDPHEHDYFLFGYEEATETKDGYELWTCYNKDDTYINTLHYFDEEVTTEPTCAVDGTKAKTCLNCGEVIVTETTPATGSHNYQLVDTTPGDCITAPIMNYKCADCDATTTKTGKIDDGHKYVEVVVAPTCTEKGYTTATCEVCLETVIYDFTSPVGHDLTIKKSGSYCSAHDAIEYSCKKCDYSEVVAADENNLITETVIVEPTCTKSGTKSEICTLCGATVSTEIISPLSHEYSADFTIDLEATCTTAGRKSQHCIRCDAKRAITTIDPLGHSEEILPAVSATCTETGLTEGKKCSVCGEITVEQSVTEKLDHKEVTVNQHEATATEDGYTGDLVCEDCGEIITAGTVIPATGEENINCNHICHKSGFMGFLWKIVRFLYKIFGINKICDCGVAHY